MFGFASQRRVFAVIGAASLAGACSVADSFHVDPAAIHAAAYSPAVPTPCTSKLGSYALPKSLLRVQVQSTDNKPAELSQLATVVRAEKSLTFCLDHISDPLADDEIRIIKSAGQADGSYATEGKIANQYLSKDKIDNTKDTLVGNKDYGSQLLQWVVSNTVDQSERIAKTLVRTAFVALSGNSNFTPLNRGRVLPGEPVTTTLAFFEYDPFDPAQSALHNQRLRELGFCLVLENFTFNTGAMTPEQYCSAPRYEEFAFDVAYARYRSGPPPRIAGIAYRPRISYALSVYKNDNPNGRGRWRLFRQHQMAFENIAPIVSVGLTRSVFAARRVALKFNMGALQAMCLVKTSELESAVMVPYEVAKSIVALPTQVFEVKIGNINDNIDLVTAERKVVAAQKEYLDFLADATRSSFTNPSSKKADPLDKDSIPTPTVIAAPIGDSASANAGALQSDVLAQICRGAPSVVIPGDRPAGGRP